MVLVISILLLVLAIIQMVIYYRFGINFLKPMNRHDRKRIRLRRKGIIQKKPTTNQKRQKHNNNSSLKFEIKAKQFYAASQRVL